MGCENNPDRSFEGASAGAGVSSKSIKDRPALEPELALESSWGMGLAAKVKSPFLKASYRDRTVLIWSLI